MSSDPVQLGPGTLTIGAAGTPMDISCLVNSCTITSDNDTGDSRTMLCGTVRPGAITFTYEIGGNVDTDTGDAEGLFALSQAAKGQVLPFTFTPNTPSGTSAAGTLRITPLDFGGDEYGADMNSDFAWEVLGEPTYTYGSGAAPAGWYEPFVFTGPAPGPVTAATLTPPADAPAGSTDASTTTIPQTGDETVTPDTTPDASTSTAPSASTDAPSTDSSAGTDASTDAGDTSSGTGSGGGGTA